MHSKPRNTRRGSSRRVRWVDMIHLTPEEAVSFMASRFGIRMCTDDAAAALASARRRSSYHSTRFMETVADFKRDGLGKKIGGNVGTSDLFKLITQKRDPFSVDNELATALAA